MSTELGWGFRPLGLLSEEERAAYYESLFEGSEAHNMFGGGRADLFENPGVHVGVLLEDGTFGPPSAYSNSPCIATNAINVFLDKYYVASMPRDRFLLQILLGSRHLFSSREEGRVAHSMTVRGVIGDYANYLSEPVFSNLIIEDKLSLDIAVNFLGDNTSDGILQFLQDEHVRKGVALVSAYNPVYGTLAGYVQGIAQMLLSRHKNRCITDTKITFSRAAAQTSIPLRQGTYLLLQLGRGDQSVNFRGMRYDQNVGAVVSIDDGAVVSRNHMLLRVEAAPPST